MLGIKKYHLLAQAFKTLSLRKGARALLLTNLKHYFSTQITQKKKNKYGRTSKSSRLAAERWRVALLLTLAMMFFYFGFILLIAFNKPLMGTLVVPGLSWGILLGALVIISAWVLIYIYVRWANNSYDEKIARLTQRPK